MSPQPRHHLASKGSADDRARVVGAKILFLFNHDAAHQVAHLGGVVRTMRMTRPDAQIICATATPGIRERLRHLLGPAV